MENNTIQKIENSPPAQLGEVAGYMPGNLIAQAIEKNGSIEVIERLMDLQERWEKNQARKSFLDAMNKFQSIVPSLEKKKLVSYQTSKGKMSYKYAPLGEIVEEIKGALKETGLSYRWEINENGSIIFIS